MFKNDVVCIKCESESRHVPPQFVLDRIADQKMSGRYDVRRSNICTVCNITRYANGTCNCDA